VNATETTETTTETKPAPPAPGRALRKGEKFMWFKQLPGTKFSSCDFAVALAIANRTNEMGKNSYPALKTLVEETGRSNASVVRSIENVIASGLIAKVRTGGGRVSNEYELRIVERVESPSNGSVEKLDVTPDDASSSLTDESAAVSAVESSSLTDETRTDPKQQITTSDQLLRSSETSAGGFDKRSTASAEAPKKKPKTPLDPRNFPSDFHASSAIQNDVDVHEALNKFCWQHAGRRAENWGAKFGQYIKSFAKDREEIEFHVPNTEYDDNFDYVAYVASLRTEEARQRAAARV